MKLVDILIRSRDEDRASKKIDKVKELLSDLLFMIDGKVTFFYSPDSDALLIERKNNE